MNPFKIFQKNLKILLRSKGSAAVILLAPLIIVLIIGAGFYDTTDSQIPIGIYKPDNSNLTNRYITNLESEKNKIIQYESEDECIRSIEQTETVTCIIFPQDFVLEDNKYNQLKIYVDESRINLVHQIISSLSSNVEFESAEVRKEITDKLLLIVAKAEAENEENIKIAQEMLNNLPNSINETSDAETLLSNVNDSDEDLDMFSLSGKFSSFKGNVEKLRRAVKNSFSEGNKLLEKIDYNGSERKDFENVLSDINKTISDTNKIEDDMDALSRKLNLAATKAESLRKKLEASRNAKETTIETLKKLEEDFKSYEEQTKTMLTNMIDIRDEIKSFQFRNSESIVNPVSTSITTITTHNKVTYSFPYLLMLIILFVGIMLSGMLVFMEKDSKAHFRTHTTPVKESFFTTMTFVTSLIIICVQTIIILAIANLALEVPLLTNFFITILTILLGISLFILLGMLLGYIFSTSEGIMMSSITIGAIMLFFSNLILPIENLSPTIQAITRFNPYVVTSETLRKSILFNTGINTLLPDLGIILGYIALILVIMLVVNRRSSPLYKLENPKKSKDVQIPVNKYLYIPEKNLVIKDLITMLDGLRALTDKEFNAIERKNKTFSKWLFDIYHDKYLRLKLKNKSREKTIDILLKYLNS